MLMEFPIQFLPNVDFKKIDYDLSNFFSENCSFN